MRIDSVTAVEFGPFKDATLEFAPQLTVVYGPNEAGKSTWHAAIYAALCGMRRGKGQPRTEDRDFTARRRPWSGSGWEVRSLVRLDDGRRIELRQNLSDLAHCSATDADLGRDVSSEILNEGTPDAAKWLGLDRQSFLSVACVRQAEVQAVADADNVRSLQDELQRAAASATRGETAAGAIARIEDFQRENVGLDRANGPKPFQRAKSRLAAAETALGHAREMHADWLTVEAQALGFRKIADEAERRQRMFQARLARKEAEAWRARVGTARKLAAKFPDGQPGPLSDDETLAGDVAAALSEWGNRLAVPVLAGRSATAILLEIQALPAMPTGDLVPHPEVVAAKRSYERASQAPELHERQRPSYLHGIDAKGLTADQLRELARALETPIPSVDADREASVGEARGRLEALERWSASRPLAAGLAAAAVLGGAGLWALGNSLIGSAVLISGVSALVWLIFRSGEAGRTRALEELHALEAHVLAQRKAAEDARAQVTAAGSQITKCGLSGDSDALRALADGLVMAERNQQMLADWSRSHEELRSDVTTARQVLEQALRQRGIGVVADVMLAYQDYERACQLCAELAARAATRQPLEQQWAAREAAEQAGRDAEARLASAREKILETIARCGQGTHDLELAIVGLRRWQSERKEKSIAFEAATREYAELNALLAGGTLAALESQSAELRQRARVLEVEVGHACELPAGVIADEDGRRAEAVARDAANAATTAETQAGERARNLPSVAEAEEALATAQAESDRVTRLARTLTSTLAFLRTAEDRVHRDIAPLLADALRQWLPDVTQGRYTDARVDPSDLCVKVLGPGGEWRDAQRLSHGTAEQIYLLLRVVLAERLATTGETCPLLLDDVLVQCDRVRKRALLDVILTVSRTRQVILLTQEEEVLEWAKEHVVSPNRLEMLPGPSMPVRTI